MIDTNAILEKPALCECGNPASVTLRGILQCEKCAAIERLNYPIGWAGKEAAKNAKGNGHD